MTITADPLFTLVTLAALLAWTILGPLPPRWFYRGLLRLLIHRMQRRHRCTIVVHAGAMERNTSIAMVRAIRRAPIDRPLVLVIDTRGGAVDAGLQVGRALAAHRGRVLVRVPDECWSSGTMAALGADEIILAPDANLGFCDVIAHTETGVIHTGPTMTAQVRGDSIEVVRSRHALRDVSRSLTAARRARGETVDDASALAERMTMSDCDHWQPLFYEEAKALGLPVRVDPDQSWFELVRLAGRC